MKFLIYLLLLIGCNAQVYNVHNDSNQTGRNPSETLLTPANISNLSLVNTCNMSVDDRVFAQPLYVPNVTISGVTYNLIITVTMNDSIYAFNAQTCQKVWSNLAFDTPYSGYPHKETPTPIYGNLGCLSTPVVDASNSRIYVVCDSATGPQWYARVFNLLTGTIITTSSALTGQVAGTGGTGISGGDTAPGSADTTSGGNVVFFPQYEFQRTGLILSADKSLLYVGFAGLDDNRPYHGWLMALNTTTLAVSAIWCSSPNSWGGGIWQSGGAPSIDASGNVYITTGNGFHGGDSSAHVDQVIQLSKNLVFENAFVPADEGNGNDDTDDADVASNRFLLIPGTVYGVSVSKDFFVYVLNTTTMALAQTAFQTCSSCTPTYNSGAYGSAFGNNILYVPTTGGSLYAFTWNPISSTFTTTPLWSQTSNSYGSPGPAQMSVSCNGASNCILWIITDASSAFTTQVAGTLRALNPSTGTQLWSSGSLMGNLTKFAEPLIANGAVYVATPGGEIQMFSVPISAQISGQVSISGLAA